ncbi:CBS domain-containing protein [Eubacteriales bacterium OttesenSCG-928-N13]|nr:CBS domain-containing protein [Eubacteriales bacterium OttesenSCG-928-N13]
MRSEEFLNLYRTLEDELENKYLGVHKTNPSVVMQYLNDTESLPVREQLDLCREIRNILSHNPDMQGEPVVEPAEALLDSLKQIIEYIKRPPLALDFATRHDQLLWADMGQRVLEVMRAMEKRGFSHVPVLQKGELVGVFSMGTVFSFMTRDMGEKGITPATRVRDFLPWLPIEKHTQEIYAFIDEGATYADVKFEFERIKKGGKRLAALFVTKTGEQTEPLIGMITPWDVLRNRGTN